MGIIIFFLFMILLVSGCQKTGQAGSIGSRCRTTADCTKLTKCVGQVLYEVQCNKYNRCDYVKSKDCASSNEVCILTCEGNKCKTWDNTCTGDSDCPGSEYSECDGTKSVTTKCVQITPLSEGVNMGCTKVDTFDCASINEICKKNDRTTIYGTCKDTTCAPTPTPTPSTPIPINGVCGTTQNSCTAGTSLDVSDTSSYYKWNCQGINGGTTASCQLEKPIDGKCGTTPYGCDKGLIKDADSTETDYKWKCVGTDGGTTMSCSSPKSSPSSTPTSAPSASPS